MEIDKKHQENLLPSSFSICETGILGGDGFLYDINYAKDGCIISKFYVEQ